MEQNTEKDPRDVDLERLMDACDRLSAYFETVQIFATKPNKDKDNSTLMFNQGQGNYFARYGQVKDWILREEEVSRNQVRGG